MAQATEISPNLATGKNQGLDIEKIRKDFPMLQRKINGKPIIYLDSAATNQKPQVVIDTLNKLYTQEYAKPQEEHQISKMMTKELENSRQKVADFINASASKEIIFTSGCTEGINIIANGFARAILQKDDEVLITELEHHANISPWQIACELSGAKLIVAPVSNDGEINLGEFENYISEKTKIISVSHSSHVLGTILPVEEIAKLAHKKGIPLLVDAAQSAPHMPIDVQKIDCDFLTFSAHKMGGPAGVGFLYGKSKWLDKIPPHNAGSENAEKVTFEETKFKSLPHKFEAGTPAFEEIVAVGSLVDYVQSLDMHKTEKYEQELLEYATMRLSDIDEVEIFGRSSKKEPVISFRVKNESIEDLETYLSDHYNIDLRGGKLSAEPLMKKLGVSGLVRASFCYFNTKEEIDQLVDAVAKFIKR
ncbi:MAG TPA: aminotransferase class V-fold PLP-dependent enzyme [Flavobacterium sp.]|jgi:cysteine desulfurase/selenocysteine lyase